MLGRLHLKCFVKLWINVLKIIRLVINNAKSNKLSDQVFWYKAGPRPDFKIGADILVIFKTKLF